MRRHDLKKLITCHKEIKDSEAFASRLIETASALTGQTAEAADGSGPCLLRPAACGSAPGEATSTGGRALGTGEAADGEVAALLPSQPAGHPPFGPQVPELPEVVGAYGHRHVVPRRGDSAVSRGVGGVRGGGCGG
ncbi:hypothetical protein PV341_26105 [Streptomyces sp. PA03-1a]|nr:hypothetical protein [Streptomyces sp. PA03-1a]